MKKNIILFIIALSFVNLIKSKISRPRPLANLGATCYMNATLQCLYQIEPLTNFLLSKDLDKGRNFYKSDPDSLALKYIDFLEMVTTQKAMSSEDMGKICPFFFTKFFKGGSKYKQEDASEFLNKLFDHLMDLDVKQEKKGELIEGALIRKNQVSELFLSISKSAVSTKDKAIICSPPKLDGLFKLDLEIPKKVVTEGEKFKINLDDCFNASYSEEELSDQYYCEALGKNISVIKQTKLYETAPILIIALKRFENIFTDIGVKFIKRNDAVSFPLYNFDIKPYLSDDSNQKVTQYDLFGFVMHNGSLSGGHYTSFVKLDNQWYFCNDSTIKAPKPDQIKDIVDLGCYSLAENGKDCAGSTPYILFYKRKDVKFEAEKLEENLANLKELSMQLNNFASMVKA